MVTINDRARWAKAVKHQRLVASALCIFILSCAVVATMRFSLVWKGWALLTPSEQARLFGEFRRPDWSSSRRGLEIMVRDYFLSGVKNALFALFGLLVLFLQRLRFQSDSRLWAHIEALEAGQRPAPDR